MAIGRITGPLLKANLLRDGVDLAFENDLLYLDITNGRVGINASSLTSGLPSAGTLTHDLTVVGTTRTTNLEVTTQADIATFTLLDNTLSSTSDIINLVPSGTNPVVYQAKLKTGNLQLSTNLIETLGTNTDLNITTTGTGVTNVNSDMLVNGDLHATGTITADGDIQIGDSNTDNIVFNADVNSDVIPNVNNNFNLGSDPTTGGKGWKTTYTHNLVADSITASSVVANGIELTLPQGNIVYVATNGNDTNSGIHENNPVATIKKALTLATNSTTIFIYPGTYTEIFPLTVPAGVTVKGAGIRSVNIQPTAGTNDKDAFLLNGETTIEDLSISNFFFNSVNNTGYAFRFANNFTVTTRSPYIRNVTVITRGSVTGSGDPYGFDQNDAGKGALADGSVANASSKEASMLFHSATFFTPNQETISATNGVRIEWLNSFTYFADKGLYAYSGSTGFAGAGQTRLRIDNRTGTWAVGNTVTYYDTNGTTVLASGTIASVSGNYVNLTGKQVGFQTITDRTGKTVYAQGDAKLSTSVKKFGTASLALDGTGDYITIPSQADFNFGTGDFTIEGWFYKTATPSNTFLFDFRTTDNSVAPCLFTATNNLSYYTAGGTRITATSALPSLNTWYHIALARQGTNTKLFVNGTQVGSTYVDNNNYIQSPVTIGARWNTTANQFWTGYIDDIRISKGVARYTGTFVAPTVPLTGDLNTVLLLHFNGTNNSTIFLDDGVTYQDLRTSAGGTATLINFADYSDFGAEVRSIGSANVYGTYGTYGDGDGVIVYLISQNYAYVGSGKLSTNDPNDRIAANEVVKLNRAKIYYTSVDNEGNFKVGDAFYVNQKTGDVLFNSQALTITAPSGVIFSDGVHTTTLLPESITTGNIVIHDNNIDSLTGDIIVTAASGSINLQNNTFVTGNINVTGDVNIGGNIQIGDASSDTVSFVAGINSNLTPATNIFYDLGTTSLRWNNAYLSRLEVDGLVIDNNTISTTVGNDNLILQAAGTGKLVIPSNDVQIDQSLTVTQDLTVTTGTTYLKNVGVTGTITQTGDINQTGSFTTSGTAQVTGNITATGYLQLPQIDFTGNTISTRTSGTDLQLTANGSGNVVFEGFKVSDNIIQSTATNADIVLTPQGTGSVVVSSNQSLIIPVGTTAQRPSSGNEVAGMIRYNTDLSRYEGWNPTYNQWLQLSGVSDLDGNTYIKAEASVGANDNILYFYANGNLTAYIDSTKLFAEEFQTNGIDIVNNTISAINTDTDINLTTGGTGGIKLGNFKIRNNTITNTVSGSITEFLESGSGYVKIAGTNGVVIPSGDLTSLPAVPEVGMVRFNTYYSYVEVYDGVSWVNAAGTSSGINLSQAQDIGIVSALLFG